MQEQNLVQSFLLTTKLLTGYKERIFGAMGFLHEPEPCRFDFGSPLSTLYRLGRVKVPRSHCANQLMEMGLTMVLIGIIATPQIEIDRTVICHHFSRI